MIVQFLHKKLIKKKLTISVAESCTGGLLAALMTYFPGSSKTYLGGVSSYSHGTKVQLLRVSEELILNKGAVSRDVVASMTRNIRKLLGCDYSLGITGMASPGESGIQEEPVGTVWVGFCSSKKGLITKYSLCKGTRQDIREQAVLIALTLLYHDLKGV